MRISDWSSYVCSSDLLEFSTTLWPGFADVYDSYSHHLVPKLGKLLAHDEDSYRYLIESIRRFPDMPTFEGMIRKAGFVRTRVEPLLGGLEIGRAHAELQSLMRISYAVFCLKHKTTISIYLIF